MSHGKRESIGEPTVDWFDSAVEHRDVERQILYASTHHFQQGLADLAPRLTGVQPDGNPLTARAVKERLKKRCQDFRRGVATRNAVLVIADADQPRVFERVQPSQRDIRRLFLRRARVVEQIVGDEKW